MKLSDVSNYKKYIIIRIEDNYYNLKVFRKYGILLDCVIVQLYKAPFDGPIAYLVNNNIITLRKSDASKVEVKLIETN